MDEPEDERELRLLKEWLGAQDQDVWLAFACESNYDSNSELLSWMVKQPQCEPAPALATYWYSAPRYFAQFASRDDAPSYAREIWDFFRAIEARFTVGDFAPATVGFDPANDPAPIGDATQPGLDWTHEYEDEPNRTPIPAQMRRPVKGAFVDVSELAKEWNEGVPPEVDALL